MAHIAFFGTPAAGHINPTLGAVSELVRRGHRVSYAVTTPYAAAVADAGARAVEYQTTMDDFAPRMIAVGSADRFTATDFLNVQHGLLYETAALLAPLARAFAADRPDLVVYDTLCWTGRLLAGRWGVPSVRSQPMFASSRYWSLGSGYLTVDWKDASVVRLVQAVGRLLHQVRAGITVDEFFAPDDLSPTLVYLPREFQYAGDSFGPLTHFVGPCLRRNGNGASWRPAETGRPVVLVSLGTVYNNQPGFFRACIEASAGMPWHAVLAVGDRFERAALGELPANVEVHTWLPDSLAVMRHAGVFVNHASMASTMESLGQGVPLVTVPQMAEQRANADRVVELGLGLRLAPDAATAQALRTSVSGVLADREMRARAGRWREVIGNSGGSHAAADAIESVLTTAGYP